MKRLFEILDITVYNTVFSILFLAGLILTVCEINIYRSTFINVALPVSLWLMPGIVATPFIANTLAKHYNTHSIFLQLVYNICTWGGIVVYVFIASNFYFARGDISSVEVPIQQTGHLAKGRYGCGEPYAEVVYQDIDKQLIFSCDVSVERYNTVELKIQKGLWGFDVINSQRLLRK